MSVNSYEDQRSEYNAYRYSYVASYRSNHLIVHTYAKLTYMLQMLDNTFIVTL